MGTGLPTTGASATTIKRTGVRTRRFGARTLKPRVESCFLVRNLQGFIWKAERFDFDLSFCHMVRGHHCFHTERSAGRADSISPRPGRRNIDVTTTHGEAVVLRSRRSAANVHFAQNACACAARTLPAPLTDRQSILVLGRYFRTA